MKDQRWVQHISGQGEKWAVRCEDDVEYCVAAKAPGGTEHFLPKSEYTLCAPSERWVDVTAECRVVGWVRGISPSEVSVTVLYHDQMLVSIENGYCLHRVQLWPTQHMTPQSSPVTAFIVEKKVPA